MFFRIFSGSKWFLVISLAKMATLMLQRIEKLKTKHKDCAAKALSLLQNKQASTSKALNLNDITSLNFSLSQLNHFIGAMGDLALLNASVSDQINDAFNNVTKSNPPSAPSFAQIVKDTESLDNFIQRKQKESEDKTIIVMAKPDISPADVLSEVNNRIKDLRNNNSKIKINKLIKSKTGAIIKLNPKEDIESLINEFKKYDSLNQRAQVFAPKALEPTIVIKSISKLTDYKNLLHSLLNESGTRWKRK